MPTYEEFFLNGPAKVVQLELLEISHPNFTKTYRIVRNKVGGCIATVDGTAQTFDYYPLKIVGKGVRDDLDYGLEIHLGDLGDILSVEMDAVAAADAFDVRPAVRYWTFRSDDMTAPLFGPVTLQVAQLPMTREGTSFEAMAPSLNANRTGEMYLISRFPTLKGTL
jgi:hypothetical protein